MESGRWETEHPRDAARRFLTDTQIETAWARGRVADEPRRGDPMSQDPDRRLASAAYPGRRHARGTLLGGADHAGQGLADAVGGLVRVGLAGIQPRHHRLDQAEEQP